MSVNCTSCGRRNPDGAELCTNPTCGAYLRWAGEYTMSLPDRGGRPRRAGIRVELSALEAPVAPGGAGAVTLTVHNTGTIVEGVAVTVHGAAARWCTVEPPRLSVYPDQSASCTLRFAPPRTAPAGRALFQVRCASLVNPGLLAATAGVVRVGAVHELTAQLVPAVGRGRGRTRHRLRLDNRGNTVERVRLTIADAEGALTIRPAEAVLDLQPGRVDVPVSVRAPRLWFGAPRVIPLQASITPLAGPDPPPLRLDGTRHVPALFPRWSLTAALLVLLLAGGGTAAVTLTGNRGPAEPPVTATSTLGSTTTASPPPSSTTTTTTTTSTTTTTTEVGTITSVLPKVDCSKYPYVTFTVTTNVEAQVQVRILDADGSLLYSSAKIGGRIHVLEMPGVVTNRTAALPCGPRTGQLLHYSVIATFADGSTVTQERAVPLGSAIITTTFPIPTTS